MTRIGWLSVMLVVVGIVGGVRRQWLRDDVVAAHAADPSCADCVVLDVDLHAHTRFSDGMLSPMELVLLAKRRGLDAVAVTEHNVLFPAQIARWFSALVDGPIVLTGQEVTTRRYHLIAVGLRERVVPQNDLRAVIAEVHRQGGVAIAAHPTRRYWPAFDAVRDDLDATEVVHPASFRPSGSFSWSEMVAFYERPGQKRLTAVGASDYHFLEALGVCRTQVIAAERSEAAILDALRTGATHVVAPDGRRFGRVQGELPAARAALGYRAFDGLDAVTRIMGWLGVMGLLLFRRRAASP